MNDSDESTPSLVTCRCQHCDGGIEFDANQLGEEGCDIPCPHCGLETKLFIPQVVVSKTAETSTSNANELLSFAQDKSNSLQARIAAFKSYTVANKPNRDAELKQIEDFLKKHESTAKIHWNQDELVLAVDKVIIRKRGLANALASGMNGERTILIASITAMQLKSAGLITPGYILFSYAGSKPFMGGVLEATQDPDTFLFGRELNAQVADFKVKVEKIMRDAKQSVPTSNSTATLTDEIRKLAELKQQGLLSQEEFEAAKRKLLA